MKETFLAIMILAGLVLSSHGTILVGGGHFWGISLFVIAGIMLGSIVKWSWDS